MAVVTAAAAALVISVCGLAKRVLISASPLYERDLDVHLKRVCLLSIDTSLFMNHVIWMSLALAFWQESVTGEKECKMIAVCPVNSVARGERMFESHTDYR